MPDERNNGFQWSFYNERVKKIFKCEICIKKLATTLTINHFISLFCSFFLYNKFYFRLFLQRDIS